MKLDDELRFLESYLEIEKTRFEERLAYSFDVDPAIRSSKIPPMILQPMVENAIYGNGGSLKLEEMSPTETRAVLILPQFVGVPS